MGHPVIVIIGARAHTADQAVLLARSGMPLVEISALGAESFGRDVDVLRRLQDSFGTRFFVHGPEEGDARDPAFLQKEMLPRINAITDCLPVLGIALFTIHFWLDSRFISARVIEEKLLLLRCMAKHAAEQGVQLCLENLSERAADFAPALDGIEALGMTLDIGHAELLGEKNTAYDFLARHAEKIYHMHVHDNMGGSGPADDLHLPPGEGRIDFSAILSEAAERGYDRTIILEVEPHQASRAVDYIQKAWNTAAGPERTAG